MARHAAVVLSLALLALGAASAKQFNYTNPNVFWPVLFPTCGSGQSQSPINVFTREVVQFCSSKESSESTDDSGEEEIFTVQFRDWGEAEAKAKNAGQTFEVEIESSTTDIRVPIKNRKVFGVVKGNEDSSDSSDEDSNIIYDDSSSTDDDDDSVTFARVTPLQFHFHTPSENTLDGVQFGMEAHLVTSVPIDVADCWNLEGQKVNCLVVFSTLFERSFAGVQNTFISSIFDGSLALGTSAIDVPLTGTYGNWSVDFEFPPGVRQVSATANQTAKALNTLDLAELMPSDMDYYYWNGSLTTPQCNESVTWILFQNPQSVSSAQVTQVQDNFANNRRLCNTDCQNRGGSAVACSLLCLDVGATSNNRPTQNLNNRAIWSSVPLFCPSPPTVLQAGRKVAPGAQDHTLTLTSTT